MSNFVAIDKLYHWSGNYQSPNNPFALYSDIIGFSDEHYGDKLCSVMPTLGYLEMTMLGEALMLFEDNGLERVYAHIEKLIAHTELFTS